MNDEDAVVLESVEKRQPLATSRKILKRATLSFDHITLKGCSTKSSIAIPRQSTPLVTRSKSSSAVTIKRNIDASAEPIDLKSEKQPSLLKLVSKEINSAKKFEEKGSTEDMKELDESDEEEDEILNFCRRER